MASLRHDLVLDRLAVPIVLAPLAGGPSTPELTAAVSNAGGFGFLAAGYLTVSALAERLERTRTLTDAPIGVNLFVPSTPAPPQAVDAYAARLADDARHAGVELERHGSTTTTGQPSWSCSSPRRWRSCCPPSGALSRR